MYVSNVAVDTTRLTYHYFIAVLLFLYCLDAKSALAVFSLHVIMHTLYRTT